jgi:hypothetical protein
MASLQPDSFDPALEEEAICFTKLLKIEIGMLRLNEPQKTAVNYNNRCGSSARPFSPRRSWFWCRAAFQQATG